MKRLIVGGLLALLVFGVVGGALAATAPVAPPYWTPWANLNDKQKKDLTDLHNQMLALRERMIDKYLEYKWITPEQAQLMKDRIALQKKYAEQYGYGFGMGFGGYGCGMRGGRGGRGPGMMRGGFGPGFGAGWYGPGVNPSAVNS